MNTIITSNTTTSHIHILRRKQLEERTGYSRSTVYARIQAGLLPSPISIGVRAVGWIGHEIDAVLSATVAGRSEAEIRELVADLTAQRKHVA